MSFLDKNYESPKENSDGYMKLQSGENRFRILCSPIVGWEDWTPEKKPKRYPYVTGQEAPAPFDPAHPPKHFWSLIVWNVGAKKVQILHITQTSVRKAIEKLSRDADWGAPFHYDIKVVKSGEQKDTRYDVTPLPHKPISEEIKTEFYARAINLEAMFTNDDPFKEGSKQTLAFWELEA